jgi:hypothetical protein
MERDKFIDTFGPKDNSGKLLKLKVFGIFLGEKMKALRRRIAFME